MQDTFVVMQLTWLANCSEISNNCAARWRDWDDSLALWDDGLNEVLCRIVDVVVGRRQAIVDKCNTSDRVRRLLSGNDVESVHGFLRERRSFRELCWSETKTRSPASIVCAHAVLHLIVRKPIAPIPSSRMERFAEVLSVFE
jgi:hypothetical protein